MDSLISENRGLLLLGVFASLGALSLLRLDQPEPSPFPGIPRETTGAYVDDVVPYEIGHEEPEPPPRHRMVHIEEAPGPKLTPLPYSVPALPHPASVAETAYVMFWEEFIGDMDLSDEPSVRSIITEWHQFNLELIFAQQEGHITIYELAQGILSVDDLQARLAPYLTASQLIDIEANFEAFMEYVAGEHA
ncbi:MAG: hypothetical protein F4030_00600 [Gammaproteobacteria bacterium]|nr:hypothetical protein [Gammaproteobacteria bacterium]MYH84312.1 hypothetical protein [Gammaproteobacteria bacterium]MYK03469.1 hypothetical protein [Gammaproteobacteria bacterium]